MKARQAVVCPKCGALNRPTWEFCARCNESLEGALSASRRGRRSTVGRRGRRRPSSVPANAIALVAVARARGSGVAGLALRVAGAAARRAPTRRSSRSPTRPPELPHPPLRPTGAGAADYEDGRRLMNAGDLAGAVARLAAAVAADPGNAEYQQRLRPRPLAQRRPGGGARGARRGGPPRPAPPDAVRAQPRRRRAAAPRRPAQYEEILAQNPGAVDGPRGPRAAALPERRLREGRLAPAAGGPSRGRTTPCCAGAGLLARPGRATATRPRPSTGRCWSRRPRPSWPAGCSPTNLVEQGKKDEALAVLQEGLKATPTAPLLHRQMGAVLERSGRPRRGRGRLPRVRPAGAERADAKELVDRAARLEAAGRKP